MATKKAVTAVSIGAGLLVLVGGFLALRSTERPPDEAPAGDGTETVVPALCRARERAPEDAMEARRIFLNEVHGPLHVVADEAAAADRTAAAELLEAKHTVESRLEEASIDAPSLERELDSLIEATKDALEAVDVEVQTCA